MPMTWKELRAYTRLRRLPVVRVSATKPTAEFNLHGTRYGAATIPVVRLKSTAPSPNIPPHKHRKRGLTGEPIRLIQGPPSPPGHRLRDILRAQRGLCFLCAKTTTHPNREHVIPRVHGGWNFRNVLAAHPRCNTKKADRMPYACELLYVAITYDILDKPAPIRRVCVA